MDKAVIAQTVADEVAAARGCMVAALNSLTGPHGKAFGRCISDLYYACHHLASALLASKGVSARSHEAAQKLLALHFVKPAALPQETIAKLNDLMDKRHAADYRPYVRLGAEDIVAARPWVGGFVRDTLKLLGKSAPADDAKALLELVDSFERLALR
jgi:uncharacterized protein (UPF0332 family)